MAEETISSTPYTTVTKVIPAVEHCLKVGLVPIIKGSPGVGKSAVVKAIAEKHNLKLIDVRLTQLDPTDLNGFPIPDKESGRSKFLPPEQFPLSTDPLPQHVDSNGKPLFIDNEGKITTEPTDKPYMYKGWLLFLDEITNASNMLQAAAYKVTLDREVGNHALHTKCAIVCAGNLSTDRAAANALNTAMQSRLVHFNVKSDIKEWMEWAYANNIDSRVTSYLEWKPDSINKFNPNHVDDTFACERTWEFVSKYITGKKEITPIDETALRGTIGVGVSNEFTAFCAIYEELPDIDKIQREPTKAHIPNERPDVMFALTGAIAERLTKDTVDDFKPYIERMDIEFQMLTVKAALGRNPALRTLPKINDWAMNIITRTNRAA